MVGGRISFVCIIVIVSFSPHSVHPYSLSLIMSDKAAIKAAKRARFEGVFDQIADELLAYLKGEGMPAEAVEWYKSVSPSWCCDRCHVCGSSDLPLYRTQS